MKYIVYLTTNLVNNKIYVGVHKTENPEIFDGYIGNSINIFKANPELNHPKLPFHKAVKKYGYSSFRRQTIQIFDTEEEALDLEAEIVNEEFIKRADTYNSTIGGGLPPLLNKVVYQYDFNGNFIKEWFSLAEVENNLHLCSASIGRAAQYKRTSGKWLWSFEKMDKLPINEYIIYSPKIPVYLYSNDKTYIKCFESMSECAKEMDISLSRVQRGTKLGNCVNGYYLSLTLSPKYIEPTHNCTIGTIHQYDIDGNYICSFLTGKELKEKTGYSEYEINRAIKMDRIYKDSLWARGQKVDALPSKRQNLRKSRKIGQYTQEGQLVKIFNTLRSARKEFPNISKVLNGIANHCHGYLFKYLE